MVFILVAFGFLPELVVLSVSCAPKALTQGTIEVFNAYQAQNTSNYPVNVSLDGGNTNGDNSYNAVPGASGGLLYTFSNDLVAPGNHTLAFSFYQIGAGAVTCCTIGNTPYYGYYEPGPGATGGGTSNGGATPGPSCSLTFNVNGGEIYEAYVTEGTGSPCGNAISITHM